MATLTQVSPQAEAAHHLQAIETLFPNLPEPSKSIFKYTSMSINDPQLANKFREVAGVTVHVYVKLANKVNHPVTMRGSIGAPDSHGNSGGILDWATDRATDTQSTPDFFSRTFTFLVPREKMHETMQFKLCTLNPNKNTELLWSKGNNWSYDLSKYGNIAIIEVENVAF